MKVERPRAARYVFVAPATLTDLESSQQTQESTWDLSLFGCQVMPGTSSRIGARVRVQIVHSGATFEAVLDQWLAAARNNGNHQK